MLASILTNWKTSAGGFAGIVLAGLDLAGVHVAGVSSMGPQADIAVITTGIGLLFAHDAPSAPAAPAK